MRLNHKILDVALLRLRFCSISSSKSDPNLSAISAMLFSYKPLGEDPLDGVILDLTVPGGMGGKETLNELIRIDPEVKALVSSGYANDPVMAEYKRYGFRSVVPKPYNIAQLGKALHDLFA